LFAKREHPVRDPDRTERLTEDNMDVGAQAIGGPGPQVAGGVQRRDRKV
jgi:hypothetical protein